MLSEAPLPRSRSTPTATTTLPLASPLSTGLLKKRDHLLIQPSGISEFAIPDDDAIPSGSSQFSPMGSVTPLVASHLQPSMMSATLTFGHRYNARADAKAAVNKTSFRRPVKKRSDGQSRALQPGCFPPVMLSGTWPTRESERACGVEAPLPHPGPSRAQDLTRVVSHFGSRSNRL